MLAPPEASVVSPAPQGKHLVAPWPSAKVLKGHAWQDVAPLKKIVKKMSKTNKNKSENYIKV